MRRGGVDLARTISPGALAGQLLDSCRLSPPLPKFDLGQAELERWAEGSHGGWCEVNPALVRRVLPVVAADVRSAYPLVAHWLDWWDALRAERLQRQDVTDALRRLCQKAVGDPLVALDPAVWRRAGLTLAEVWPAGERFPHAFEDPHHLDDRLEVVGVRSPERALWYPWADVLAAAVLSGRVPRIAGAVRLVPNVAPSGKDGGRHVRVLPGLRFDVAQGPVLAMVRRRRKAKAQGDERLAAELRVVVNALIYGVHCRFDEVTAGEGRRRVMSERPGPWNFLPISASVTAGARLLLAVLERMVGDLGGAIAYRDTDSALILASPSGGELELADGRSVRVLAWAEVDAVLAPFARLSPEDAWPVWKQERGDEDAPLQALVFGNKRHVEWAGEGLLLPNEAEDEEPELLDATEANLGGTYADPPGMRGRVAAVNGYRHWSMAAVRREADHAKAGGRPDALRPPAPWDEAGTPPFPALRRLMVKTPAMAKALPACLRARPGTRYLEAQAANEGQRCVVPVVLDPGGDLAGWQGLTWVDRRSGQRIPVTTDAEDYDSIRVVTLDEKAADWSRPSRRAVVTEVVVDPRRIRVKGRVSPVLDATSDEGSGTDAAKRRLVYRPVTCECGCGTALPTGRPDKRFVFDAHRKRAARASQKVAL